MNGADALGHARLRFGLAFVLPTFFIGLLAAAQIQTQSKRRPFGARNQLPEAKAAGGEGQEEEERKGRSGARRAGGEEREQEGNGGEKRATARGRGRLGAVWDNGAVSEVALSRWL